MLKSCLSHTSDLYHVRYKKVVNRVVIVLSPKVDDARYQCLDDSRDGLTAVTNGCQVFEMYSRLSGKCVRSCQAFHHQSRNKEEQSKRTPAGSNKTATNVNFSPTDLARPNERSRCSLNIRHRNSP